MHRPTVCGSVSLFRIPRARTPLSCADDSLFPRPKSRPAVVGCGRGALFIVSALAAARAVAAKPPTHPAAGGGTPERGALPVDGCSKLDGREPPLRRLYGDLVGGSERAFLDVLGPTLRKNSRRKRVIPPAGVV